MLGVLFVIMHWLDGEFPTDCVRRALSAFPGDHELRSSGLLPVEREKDRIVEAVRGNQIVAVKAQPGSGKTMCIPDYLFELPDEKNRVLVMRF